MHSSHPDFDVQLMNKDELKNEVLRLRKHLRVVYTALQELVEYDKLVVIEVEEYEFIGEVIERQIL